MKMEWETPIYKLISRLGPQASFLQVITWDKEESNNDLDHYVKSGSNVLAQTYFLFSYKANNELKYLDLTLVIDNADNRSCIDGTHKGYNFGTNPFDRSNTHRHDLSDFVNGDLNALYKFLTVEVQSRL